MTRRVSPVVLLLLAAMGSLCPAAEEAPAALRVVGGKTALWLLREREADFDLLVRKIGGSWRRSEYGLSGRIAWARAVGPRLHLLFRGGEYALLDAQGEALYADSAPGEVLAVAAAGSFGPWKGPALMAMVLRTSAPDALTAPTTTSDDLASGLDAADADVSGGGSKPGRSEGWASSPPDLSTGNRHATPKSQPRWYRCLYRAEGGRWQALSCRPLEGFDPSRSHHSRLAYAAGEVYFLSDITGALEFHHLRPGDVETPLPPPPDSDAAEPLRMVAVDDTLVFLQPMQGKDNPVRLVEFDPQGEEYRPPRTITNGGVPAAWPEGPPKATRQGQGENEQLMLFWTENGQTLLASCGRNGALRPAENLSQAVETLPDPQRARTLREYFLWGVLAAILLGMFALRPRDRARQFLLDDRWIPGNLLRRFLAAAADYLLFGVPAALWILQSHSPEQIMERTAHPETAPFEFVAVVIATQTAYVLYGTILELRYGRTLGKRLMRLRVVGQHGARPNLREAALRNLLKILELSTLGGGSMCHAWWRPPRVKRSRGARNRTSRRISQAARRTMRTGESKPNKNGRRPYFSPSASYSRTTFCCSSFVPGSRPRSWMVSRFVTQRSAGRRSPARRVDSFPKGQWISNCRPA
jgi:uncharacterized RDD family membrane protein YckC